MIKFVVDKRLHCSVCYAPGPHPGDASDAFSDEFLIEEARDFGWFHIMGSTDHREQILCSEKCLRKYARKPGDYDANPVNEFAGG